MEELKRGFKPVEVVSAVLELPEVIMCIPGVLSLIMVRACVQWSSILAAVSGDNADHVGVGTHDHPSEACWYAPPPVVSDDAWDVVGPSVVVKA